MLHYLIIELFFGALEFFATLVISLMFFRIPFKYHFYKLVATSFFVSGLFLLLYNFLNIPFPIGETIVALGTIWLIYILTGLKLWQSVLVTLIGFIMSSLLQAIIYRVFMALGFTDMDMISNTPLDLLYLMTIQFIYACIIFQLAFIFHRYKLGFLFSDHVILEKKKPRIKYVELFSFILFTLFACLFFTHYIIYDISQYHEGKLIIGAILVIISLAIVYAFTKNSVKEEYEKIRENVRL